MSEIAIDTLEEDDELTDFEESHYYTTMESVRALCLKHGTDNILENIKEYLSLEQSDSIC